MAAKPPHRVLITGGTGFVGSLLADFLARTCHDCIVTALGHGDSENAIDLLDPAAVDAVIAEVRPTAVVHLAAIAVPSEASKQPRYAWDVNFTGTLNLADAVTRNAPAARFIYVGSSEAYGASFKDAAGPVNEDTPLRPMTVYAATKAAADLMVGQKTYDGLRAIRFRPFNHTGPGQADRFVVPAFAHQVARIAAGKAEPVVKVGNIDVERDIMDVRDVVRAYADAAVADKIDSADPVFNLASGNPTKIRHILDALIAESGVDIEISVDPDRLRSNDVPLVQGDASRARKELGWIPQIPLEQTLSDVFRYWRELV